MYAAAYDVVGDSLAPYGYVTFDVEDGHTELLIEGEANTNVDIYWFGTRFFVGEPLIVPKRMGMLKMRKLLIYWVWKERFNEMKLRLAELSSSFSHHVLDATKSFLLTLEDPHSCI